MCGVRCDQPTDSWEYLTQIRSGFYVSTAPWDVPQQHMHHMCQILHTIRGDQAPAQRRNSIQIAIGGRDNYPIHSSPALFHSHKSYLYLIPVNHRGAQAMKDSGFAPAFPCLPLPLIPCMHCACWPPPNPAYLAKRTAAHPLHCMLAAAKPSSLCPTSETDPEGGLPRAADDPGQI